MSLWLPALNHHPHATVPRYRKTCSSFVRARSVQRAASQPSTTITSSLTLPSQIAIIAGSPVPFLGIDFPSPPHDSQPIRFCYSLAPAVANLHSLGSPPLLLPRLDHNTLSLFTPPGRSSPTQARMPTASFTFGSLHSISIS